MSIPAIAAISAISPIGAATSTAAVTPTAAGAASGTDFAGVLGKSLDAVNGAQANASNLAVQAATGQLTDPATYTVAATQATLMTQLATTVQSKAVAAFDTIMGLQA